MSREGIWERAYKIFLHRLEYGIPGNKDSDWAQAKREIEQEKDGYTTAVIGATRVRARVINVK